MKRGHRGKTVQDEQSSKLYLVEANSENIILSRTPVIAQPLTGFSLSNNEPPSIAHSSLPRQVIHPEEMIKLKKTNFKNKMFSSKFRSHKHQTGKTLRSLMLDPLDLYTLNICKYKFNFE